MALMAHPGVGLADASTRFGGVAAASFSVSPSNGTLAVERRFGFESLRIVSSSSETPQFVSNPKPLRPPIDTTGRHLKVWFRVDRLAQLRGLEFRLTSDGFSNDHLAFAVPLFADPAFNLVHDGTWTEYTFSFADARSFGRTDRARIGSIGLWLLGGSEAAPLQVDWGGFELVEAPRRGVVSFTFDDGYDEHLLAADVLRSAGFRGTAYVIPSAIDQPGYLTRRDLTALRREYGWDIESHHETSLTRVPAGELETLLLGVKAFVGMFRGSRVGHHLAYPLGRQDAETVLPLVRKHFASARAAGGGTETVPPADRHLLRVLNVTKETRPGDVIRHAARAHEHGGWLILMFHYLVEQPRRDTDYRLEDLGEIVRGVREIGVPVLPLTEVLATCAQGVNDRANPCRITRPRIGAPNPAAGSSD